MTRILTGRPEPATTESPRRGSTKPSHPANHPKSVTCPWAEPLTSGFQKSRRAEGGYWNWRAGPEPGQNRVPYCKTPRSPDPLNRIRDVNFRTFRPYRLFI